MKAEELRIGNYVLNQTGELKNIPTGKPHKITIDDLKWHEFYVPILLTEEWLLKLGFLQNDFISMEWNYERFKISQPEIVKPNYFFRDYHWKASIRIKYVHQLQNLIFELT